MEGDGADNIRKLEKEYIGTMGGIFEEAAKRGEIRSSASIPDMVAAFLTFYTHTLLEGLNARSFYIDGQLKKMDRLVDQLSNGIGDAVE